MSLCGIPEAELLLEEGGVLWDSLLELEGAVLCELDDDGLALDGLVL